VNDPVLLRASKDKLAAALEILFASVEQRMEKYGVITGAPLWIEMRDTRNRVAHEYLPQERAKIYADIVGPAAAELRYVLRQSLAHM